MEDTCRDPAACITDADYLAALYDQEIRYLDDGLAEVFGTLAETRLAENTLVLLLADHGENLGEGGYWFDHGRTLREEDTEGFGVVFLEANACGKPVIGGRSGGIPEAVADGYSGLLVDPLDVQDIARAVVRILKDGQYAARLMDRALANSLIMKLYYFDGKGLQYFKPLILSRDLTGRTRIKVFEVRYE